MSNKEIKRLEILHKLLDRELTQIQASEVLYISTRQVQRLLHAYRIQGVKGLISKKRNKPSNNVIPSTIKDYAVHLIKANYVDFGPTLVAEKLLEKHEIKLSIETIRNLMIKSNIWIPKNKRQKRSYQSRYRRDSFGELIQIDGSTHHWFEDRGTKCTLLVLSMTQQVN